MTYNFNKHVAVLEAFEWLMRVARREEETVRSDMLDSAEKLILEYLREE